MKRARLVLADGTCFEGVCRGDPADRVGEVVFNTSPFGYQEILTDPSYVGQIVVMAYPEMGNVGVNPEDQESENPHAVGMVVRHAAKASNWRAAESLEGYLRAHGLFGLAEVDTRALVRHLRDHGAQMGICSTEDEPVSALAARAMGAPGMEGRDLASGISTPKPYEWTEPSPRVLDVPPDGPPPSPHDLRFHVVAYDYGLKRAMLRQLVDAGCRLTVVPASFPAKETLALKPDGIFLTNGPGDPAAVPEAKEIVSELLGKVPLFGICLGHQILARAIGGKTYKLKFGHRGANQPVQDLRTRKVEITSHNHGFAVDAESLPPEAKVTHVNLNDGTVEGLEIASARAFSVQYHPEASPGPHDARHLFHRFTALMGG